MGEGGALQRVWISDRLLALATAALITDLPPRTLPWVRQRQINPRP
jgi:hypothetical protein